jgi:hypothetical protein
MSKGSRRVFSLWIAVDPWNLQDKPSSWLLLSGQIFCHFARPHLPALGRQFYGRQHPKRAPVESG